MYIHNCILHVCNKEGSLTSASINIVSSHNHEIYLVQIIDLIISYYIIIENS